jgi:hypothetical protein
MSINHQHLRVICRLRLIVWTVLTNHLLGQQGHVQQQWLS